MSVPTLMTANAHLLSLGWILSCSAHGCFSCILITALLGSYAPKYIESLRAILTHPILSLLMQNQEACIVTKKMNMLAYGILEAESCS